MESLLQAAVHVSKNALLDLRDCTLSGGRASCIFTAGALKAIACYMHKSGGAGLDVCVMGGAGRVNVANCKVRVAWMRVIE